MKERSSFSSRIGFVLAAAGSAVGLGNMWRFPYLAAKYGGGAFLVIYILLAVTFGFTLMITEIAIGRRTRRSCIEAFKTLDRRFVPLGWLCAMIPVIITPYYCVIGGWVLKYFAEFITGNGLAASDDAFFGNFITCVVSGMTDRPLFWFALFVILTAAITNNYVLVKFLGICPFLGVSKKLDQATGMSIAVIFVEVLATAVTWPIYHLLLAGKVDFTYMETVVFILVIAALVQLVEIVLKRYIPALHKSLGVYLPLITTNCGVLGVTMNNISDGLNYVDSLLTALGCGLGFFLAMVIFSGVRSRVEDAEPPKSFEGLPITLVSASIVSLSFFGFSGVLDRQIGRASCRERV